VGRQQSEILGPQIHREFNILGRQGYLPEMPGVLAEAEGEYDITYESPAMRFQRSEELVGIQRTLEIAMPFAQADPSILSIFKPNEIIRLAAEINGAPSDILHSPEEMDEIAAQQAQQAQQQQMMEAMQQIAPAAKDLAQAQAALPAEAGLEG
jgi:hypothetical protein